MQSLLLRIKTNRPANNYLQFAFGASKDFPTVYLLKFAKIKRGSFGFMRRRFSLTSGRLNAKKKSKDTNRK